MKFFSIIVTLLFIDFTVLPSFSYSFCDTAQEFTEEAENIPENNPVEEENLKTFHSQDFNYKLILHSGDLLFMVYDEGLLSQYLEIPLQPPGSFVS